MILYEKISVDELRDMKKNGVTPNFTYEDYLVEKDEETGEITGEFYINLTIHKTSDEVYQKWINSQDNPNEPLPNQNVILLGKVETLEDENKLLKAQIEALNATTDFQEDLIVEMAMIVYA